MDKQERFVLNVVIKRADANALIFFKEDGRRFEHERTIKMKIQTPYEFNLTFRPPRNIKSACLRGEHLDVENGEYNSELTRYKLKWDSSDIGITKKNKRELFPLVLDIHNVGTLELPLQFKFYDLLDVEHSAWGKCLHEINYGCYHKQENSLIEIRSAVYR